MKVESRSRRRAAARRGFTLVELLVVVAIILALLSLLAAASVKIIGTQQTKNTETDLQKLADALDMHWKSVVAIANRETIPTNVQNLAGSDARAGRRARVIWIKLRLKQEFPVTLAEALAPWNTPATGALQMKDLPPRAGYVSALNGINIGAVPAEAQSSACLYLALNESRSGIQTSLDSLLNPSELIETRAGGGNTLRLITDAWLGPPLVFSRWPYQDPGLNPTGMPQAAPPWQDPEDPEGLLSDPAWAQPSNPGFQAFVRLCHPAAPGKSFKLRPVIVSAGPDKDMGLANFQTLQVGTAKANDNIYSYRIRLGGSSN